MSSYLSAFGAKRTWRDRRWRIDRSLMTQSGHERAAFAAIHGTDLIYSARFLGLGQPDETARAHLCPQRRGRMAARGARAAGRAGPTRWRADAQRRGRSGVSGPHDGIPAGARAIGLARRP